MSLKFHIIFTFALAIIGSSVAASERKPDHLKWTCQRAQLACVGLK